MGHSRTLWEIGPEGAEVRELRARLGLDSGYLTRVLQSLHRQRLITITSSREDRRVRSVQLTAKGRAERAELDRRADAKALGFLEPLNDAQRARLVEAMDVVERLMRASQVTVAVEDPRSRDARWCIEQYFAELNERFDSGFDPSQSISATPDELIPPAGAQLVARLHGKAIGSGALKLHSDRTAELKRMWIVPEARGLGVGRRLLVELERYAKSHGTRLVRLETNRTLKEAIALYRASGYREVPRFNDEPYAHHWFEKKL